MLNQVRIVTHERFRKSRRIVIFLIFVFAGIASPSPDPLTMLLLGGVVIVLVEAAEVIIWLNDKRFARLHPPMYENLADDEMSSLDVPESGRRRQRAPLGSRRPLGSRETSSLRPIPWEP